MSDELRASLDTLGKLSKKLNKITDEANETVRLVEQYLEECSVGLSTRVPCLTLDPDTDGVGTPCANAHLGYERFPSADGKFRIVVIADCQEGTEIRPWSDCSRSMKLESFEYLPSLLAALVKEAQTKIDTSETKTKSIVEAVQGVISPKPKK